MFQFVEDQNRKDEELRRIKHQLMKTLEFNTQLQEHNLELQKNLSLLCMSAQKDIEDKDKRINKLTKRYVDICSFYI